MASTVIQFSCMGESAFTEEMGRTAGLYTLGACHSRANRNRANRNRPPSKELNEFLP